jgi:membrane-associated phospholipid phosphatase
MRLDRIATDLGDLFCVTALAGVVGFWCWRQLDRLTAAAFGATYAFALCATTGMKMISARIGLPPSEAAPFQLSSGAPSGHVALSVVVYGSAAYLCGKAARGWEARLVQAACLLVIGAVAVTRVTLHTHTIADVLAGALVGGLLTTLPVVLVWSRPGPGPERTANAARWLMAGMAAAALFMLASGVRMPSGDFNLP